MINGEFREEWPAEVQDRQKLHARHLFQVAHWAALGLEGVVRAGAIPWGFFCEDGTAPEAGKGENVFARDGDLLRISKLAFMTNDGHVVRRGSGGVDLQGGGSRTVELVWTSNEQSKNYLWELKAVETSPPPPVGSRSTGEQTLRLFSLRGRDGAVEYDAPFVHAGAVRESREKLDEIDEALVALREKLAALADSERPGVTDALPFDRLNRASDALRKPRSYFLPPVRLAERLEELGESVERFVNQLDWDRQPAAGAQPASREARRSKPRPGVDPLPRWKSDDPFLKSGQAVIVALRAMWTLLAEANRRILLSEELIGEVDEGFEPTVNWHALRYKIDQAKTGADLVKRVQIKYDSGDKCKFCLGQNKVSVKSGECRDLEGAKTFWLEFQKTTRQGTTRQETMRPPQVYVVRVPERVPARSASEPSRPPAAAAASPLEAPVRKSTTASPAKNDAQKKHVKSQGRPPASAPAGRQAKSTSSSAWPGKPPQPKKQPPKNSKKHPPRNSVSRK